MRLHEAPEGTWILPALAGLPTVYHMEVVPAIVIHIDELAAERLHWQLRCQP